MRILSNDSVSSLICFGTSSNPNISHTEHFKGFTVLFYKDRIISLW